MFFVAGRRQFVLFAGATAPPPPLPNVQAGTSKSVSGTLSQFNYDPEGGIEGFMLNGKTLVSLPPEWAIRMETLARRGGQLSVTGSTIYAPSGMQLVQPQTLTVEGKTLSLEQPSQPAPYAGSSVIAQLNYGPQGEVNGFVLQNGIMARTPPFGATDASVIWMASEPAFTAWQWWHSAPISHEAKAASIH